MTIVSCAHTHFALSRKQKALLYLTYDTTLLLDITPSTTGNYPPVVKKAKVKKKSQVYYRGTLDTTPLGGYAFQTTQVYIYIIPGPRKSSTGSFRHRTSWKTALNKSRALPHGRPITVDITRLCPRRGLLPRRCLLGCL